jgi:hypothetical protein
VAELRSDAGPEASFSSINPRPSHFGLLFFAFFSLGTYPLFTLVFERRRLPVQRADIAARAAMFQFVLAGAVLVAGIVWGLVGLGLYVLLGTGFSGKHWWDSVFHGVFNSLPYLYPTLGGLFLMVNGRRAMAGLEYWWPPVIRTLRASDLF